MTELLKISLPDGSVREMEAGSTPADVAAAIGPGLAKAAIAARVDGELRDINRPFDGDAELALVTSRDEEDALELARHDYAHVLAEAVQSLFPGTQITFGPSTDDGFYYDVMAPASRDPFSMDDLPAIEEEMRRIIRADKPLKREVWSREQLIEKWESEGEVFKAEWAKELPENEELTVYWSGEDWLDMCRGPHLASTGKLDPDAFKLMRVAGAYWRGDQSNAQLTRIYGTGWLNKKQLKAHLTRLEEAAKRDHRKLGKELDLFSFPDEIGSGLSVWHPKGGIIRGEMEQHARRRHVEGGYTYVYTPHIAKEDLFLTSNHLVTYKDGMFPPIVMDEEHGPDGTVTKKGQDYYLKPMNCPMHILIYRERARSYRDLPMRLAENGTVYRNELSGALHGLTRVRGFTQDDSHLFVTPEQLESEATRVLEFVISMLRDFGLDDFELELSMRDDEKSKWIGTDEFWEYSTNALRNVAVASGLKLTEVPGEAAFYGPKIDLKTRDAIGRTWQLSTVQVDPNLPERFGLEYTGPDGEKHRPIMIHRALFGSIERFFAILLEHYAGAFPVWLAPVQVVGIPVAEEYAEHLEQIVARLRAAGVRAEVDRSDDRMQKKIRTHTAQKVPLQLIAGEQDRAADAVSFRFRDGTQENAIPVDVAVERIIASIRDKALVNTAEDLA